MIALGIYLRKTVTDNLGCKQNDVIVIDAGSFGKFNLVHDPVPNYDGLFQKKLTYEPTSAMVPGTKVKVWNASEVTVTVKPLDLARLTRLCRDVS